MGDAMDDNDPRGDDILDRATRALRDEPVPTGPSEALRARTLARMNAADSGSGAEPFGARSIGHFGWPARLAAAVLVAITVAATVMIVRQDRMQIAAPVGPAVEDGNRLVKGGNPTPTDPRAPQDPVQPDNAIAKDDPSRMKPDPLPRDPNTWLASGTGASVRGTIFFRGQAPPRRALDTSAVAACAAMHKEPLLDESLVVSPDGRRLANVVVSVEVPQGVRAMTAGTPAPARLDQRECQFRPHVVAMWTGQDLVISNSDAFLHNVNSSAVENPAFNFGQPTTDPGTKVEPMRAPERFRIACNIHPWMSAQVSVFDHPFFAVSGADGAFELPAGLPDGEHTLLAWHETLGEQRQRVTVKDGVTVAEFTFEMKKAEGGAPAFDAVAAAGGSCAHCCGAGIPACPPEPSPTVYGRRGEGEHLR